MTTDIPGEQLSDAIDGVVFELLADVVITSPPVDALLVAQRLGLMVLRDETTDVRARFVRFAGMQPTIFLADEPRAERRQWAVAHEIGEHCAHRVFENLGLDPIDAPPAAREEVANRIAGRLLLPRHWFFAAGAECDWDLLELKSQFSSASHEMIARRMLESPPPVIITLWDQEKIQWRRSNAMQRPPAPTTAERDVWQAAHLLAQSARCNSGDLPDGVENICTWPIHEAHWRREIMRTQLAEQW